VRTIEELRDAFGRRCGRRVRRHRHQSDAEIDDRRIRCLVEGGDGQVSANPKVVAAQSAQKAEVARARKI